MPARVELIVPDSAEQGERIKIDAYVTNDLGWSSDFWLQVIADEGANGDLIIDTQFPTAHGARAGPFTAYYTMPDHDIILHAYVLYWGFTEEMGWDWYYYDDVSKTVSLVTAPVAGTITRMELEYDESRANIPAYTIPQGQRGLVHIWGRNDMATNQKMGIYWIVRDPDGITVQEYYDWETFWTGPGSEHEFIAGRFNLDKVGTYGIQVGLLMNYDDPLYVDIYYGDLCTVAAVVPEPEFAGFGITEYTK